MGYSYSAKAGFVLDALIEQLQSSSPETKSSNSYFANGLWHFYEHGKEQSDGAITGVIHKILGNGNAKKAGSFRIESNGKISRFIGSKKNHRVSAEVTGLLKFYETHHISWKNDKILPEYLKTASFVVI